MANGWNSKKPFPEHGGISMNYVGFVEINTEVQDAIVLTAAYNFDYLVKVMDKLIELMGRESKIQVRFAASPAQGCHIMLLKVWNEKAEKMYPEEPNRYIAIAPVTGGVEKKGFTVWTEHKAIIETVVVDRTPVTSICPNHAGAIADDEIIRQLEEAVH